MCAWRSQLRKGDAMDPYFITPHPVLFIVVYDCSTQLSIFILVVVPPSFVVVPLGLV
jgi:hypothetical protein